MVEMRRRSGGDKDKVKQFNNEHKRVAVERPLAAEIEAKVQARDSGIAKGSAAAVQYALKDWQRMIAREEAGKGDSARITPTGALVIPQRSYEDLRLVAAMLGCDTSQVLDPADLMHWLALSAPKLLGAVVEMAGDQFSVADMVSSGTAASAARDQHVLIEELRRRREDAGIEPVSDDEDEYFDDLLSGPG